MSRVGNKPIVVPQGVSVVLEQRDVLVSGVKGKLKRRLPPGIEVSVEGNEVKVSPKDNARKSRAMHGLGRALIQNMVTGVHEGFSKILDINGVGYRAEAKGGVLSLALGYSHPVDVLLPEGVDVKVEKTQVTLSSADREVLGQVAAIVREQRPPEPYKGKGC